MKKTLFLFSALFLSNAYGQAAQELAEIPDYGYVNESFKAGSLIDGDYVYDICSNLGTYQQMPQTCLNSGFTYPTIEFRYSTGNNNQVVWRVRQAKIFNAVEDYKVLQGEVICADCDDEITQAEIAALSNGAIAAMVENKDNLEIRTYSVGITTENSNNAWIPGVLKDIFSGTVSGLTVEKSKSLLSNQEGKTTSQAPLILTVRGDNGQPLGAGRIVNGIFVTEIRLSTRTGTGGRQELYWSGRVSRELGNQIIDAFEDYRWQSHECRVVYTGSDGTMIPQVICY
ncbi:hypothetical protein SG34_005040 [Thalassomonas viridans]|uniref:Uncharacterized protein n=1 Tax=Thalassomonas viridans TaxID=137584 RepID=A0AAE9Z6R7_9GAMM|nr:hypothetical protein [Thalassomonas viridans]WDE06293.1 hypothetical protein SG34_005040 [Thalassomonas viridans]